MVVIIVLLIGALALAIIVWRAAAFQSWWSQIRTARPWVRRRRLP